MIRGLFAGAVLLAACSSSSTDDSAAANGGSSGAVGCPNVSGVWKVAAHCDPSLVGMSVTVTQTDCSLTFAAPFDGFSGSVTADGKVALSGPQTCTGEASATAISMICSPGTCQVTLAR
jgi:hypothetical protein